MINKEAKATGGKSSRRRPSNASSSSSSAVEGAEARTGPGSGAGKKPRGRTKKQAKVNGINRGNSGSGPSGPNLNPHLDHVLSSMHPSGMVGGPPINLQSNPAMMEMFPGGPPPQAQFPFNDLRLSPNGMVPPPPHAVQSFGSGPYPQEWSPEGYPPPPNAGQCGFFPGRGYLDGIPPSAADANAGEFNPRALSPLSRNAAGTHGGSASSPSFGFSRFDSVPSAASPGGASEFHPQFPPQEKNGTTIPPPSSSPILLHGSQTPYGIPVNFIKL